MEVPVGVTLKHHGALRFDQITLGQLPLYFGHAHRAGLAFWVVAHGGNIDQLVEGIKVVKAPLAGLPIHLGQWCAVLVLLMQVVDCCI